MPRCPKREGTLVKTYRRRFEKIFYASMFVCRTCGDRVGKLHPGMQQQAIREFETAVNLGGGSSIYSASLAHAFGIAGRRSDALKALQSLRKMAETRFVSSYDLALVHVGLGEKCESIRAAQDRGRRKVSSRRVSRSGASFRRLAY
jgi:hypothetical protein